MAIDLEGGFTVEIITMYQLIKWEEVKVLVDLITINKINSTTNKKGKVGFFLK